jgi:1,4-dihydroxy-2-naphthoate octaprenyltransferase
MPRLPIWTTDIALELITALRLLETVTDDNKYIFDNKSGSDTNTNTNSDSAIIHGASLSIRLIEAAAFFMSAKRASSWSMVSAMGTLAFFAMGSNRRKESQVAYSSIHTPISTNKCLFHKQD